MNHALGFNDAEICDAALFQPQYYDASLVGKEVYRSFGKDVEQLCDSFSIQRCKIRLILTCIRRLSSKIGIGGHHRQNSSDEADNTAGND